MHSCTTQGDYISDGERVIVKQKADKRNLLFFRESVDESMTMNKPHWRGCKFDI